MRCPACGNEESKGTVCSRCATPFPVSEAEVEEPRSAPPEKPATPPPTTPKEGKHRPRPLHDLDLTLPELEFPNPPSSEPQREKGKEEPSIKVSDRRHHQKPEVQADPGSKPQTDAPPDSKTSSEPRPLLDFSSFVLSLGASAMMAMGGIQLPGMPSGMGASSKIDLVQAKELIDLLALLEEKTKGNLTDSESELLKQTLYNLRMKYVQISQSK